jgi:hypothetical protein
MALPFSREQFFALFEQYNRTVWPAQVILVVAAVTCLAILAIRPERAQPVAWILAFLWAWMALAYHFAFFTRINPAAWIFGSAFIVSALMLAKHAHAGTLCFARPRGAEGVLALALMFYALVGYPIVGTLAGHAYPRTPTFGLPCPTTIFTLGLLLVARRPVPLSVFAVPLAWSCVGGVAAVQLGVVQDFGLPVAAVLTVVVLALRVDTVRSGRARFSARG